MEISSSNFHLKPDGSVIISGSTTTEVNISTPKFFLGGGGQFISGSNGNLEVSSSNFHLSSSGDVTMTGAITATSGKIAGYNISGNDLSANSGNVLIEGGVGGTITLGAGIGATANRQIILNSADTAGANEVRISVGHGTQTLAPFQVNAVGAMSSSAAKISGSDINIVTPKFSLVEGSVTMSGDLSARKGTFSDVNIMGSLQKNTTAAVGDQLVETWVSKNLLFTGTQLSNITRVDGDGDDLANSQWGWTASLTGANDIGDMEVKFSDSTTLALTDNDDNAFPKDPPKEPASREANSNTISLIFVLSSSNVIVLLINVT